MRTQPLSDIYLTTFLKQCGICTYPKSCSKKKKRSYKQDYNFKIYFKIKNDTLLSCPSCSALLSEGQCWRDARQAVMDEGGGERLARSLVQKHLCLKKTHLYSQLTHTSNRYYYNTRWYTLLLTSTNALKKTVMSRVMSSWNKLPEQLTLENQ